jgi:hypothetical protein
MNTPVRLENISMIMVLEPDRGLAGEGRDLTMT